MGGERVLQTIGHSTHPIERFVELLGENGVELVADVRRHPGSRRNPQFGADALARSLAAAGIRYEPFGEGLGGRRRPAANSANGGWRVEAFRGYADHMASTGFVDAAGRLEELAARAPTAVMCAEAHPSRCHRRLIADHFLVRGWRVLHILADGRREAHALTPFARVAGGRLTYPPAQETLLD